jgi:predicted  nucleic acid-binding Zn-ribbon protein
MSQNNTPIRLQAEEARKARARIDCYTNQITAGDRDAAKRALTRTIEVAEKQEAQYLQQIADLNATLARERGYLESRDAIITTLGGEIAELRKDKHNLQARLDTLQAQANARIKAARDSLLEAFNELSVDDDAPVVPVVPE